MYPSSQGALTSLWAGTTAEGATLGGKVIAFRLSKEDAILFYLF